MLGFSRQFFFRGGPGAKEEIGAMPTGTVINEAAKKGVRGMRLKGWSVGVFGIITDGNGRILVSRREDGQGWDIPGGGFEKDRDKNFIAALRREVTEETGFSIKGKPLFIGQYLDQARRDVMLVYIIPKVSGFLRTTQEAVEHRFVDFETLKEEIQLVWQERPGHEQGRLWEILRDRFCSLLPPTLLREEHCDD